MKSLLIGLMLLSGFAYADGRWGIIVVPPTNFMQGDAVSDPLAASNGDNTLYYSRFLSTTVATMAAATGVSLVARLDIPTNAQGNSDIHVYATLTYGGVTNSATLSPTAKVQYTSYANPVALTTTTIQVGAPVALTDALLYGQPRDIRLMQVANVDPGSVVTVHLVRALGSNQVLHFWKVWAKYEPRHGWGPF